VSNSPDFSPMGAALAGAVGLGIHRDVEALAGLPSAEQRFLPTMPVAEPERVHAGWRRAVTQVLAGGQGVGGAIAKRGYVIGNLSFFA
ncbi:MAG: hypothetical protein ACTHN5_11830, partial [Phycisphaerae bacterium]